MVKITLLVLAIVVTIAVVSSQDDGWVELKKPYDPDFVKALKKAVKSVYKDSEVEYIIDAYVLELIGASWYKAKVILNARRLCNVMYVQELVSGGMTDPSEVIVDCDTY